jgi:hypothetical protein
MIPAGSLNQIGDQLQANDIEFAYMIEPDLNRALSAVCFIADERVFNYTDYPDFLNYVIISLGTNVSSQDIVRLRMLDIEDLILQFPGMYEEWTRTIGGKKNVFLRGLIKGKKTA